MRVLPQVLKVLEPNVKRPLQARSKRGRRHSIA